MLRFLTVDAKGRRLLNSGILTDVRITADARANALVISSPPENLDLLEGLVRQLDNLPAAEAQIKVFTIVNGDATSLSDMLKTLFTGQATGTAAGPQALIAVAAEHLQRQRDLAGAPALRRRHADQQRDRLGHDGRSEHRGGDPHASWTTARCGTARAW